MLVKIISWANILKCLLAGLYYLLLGIWMTFTPGGQIPSAIFGIPMMILGSIFLLGLKPSIQLLHQDSNAIKKCILFAIFHSLIFYLPLFSLVVFLNVYLFYSVITVNICNALLLSPTVCGSLTPGASVNKKLSKKSKISLYVLSIIFLAVSMGMYSYQQLQIKKLSEFDHNHPTPEMVAEMDALIYKSLERNEYVDLRVVYQPPFVSSPDYRNSDETTKITMNDKFYENHFIQPLDGEGVWFIRKTQLFAFHVKVTKAGFEKLKNTRYIRSISKIEDYYLKYWEKNSK